MRAASAPRTRGRRPGLGLLLVVAALVCAASGPVRAQSSEPAAKARFAVTFARFVQWPALPVGADTPLRLCVLQRSPALASAFAVHDGAAVGTRRLSVVLEPGTTVSGCDLLFVDGSGASAAAPLLAEGAQRPILTVGAVDGFIARGGMVELVNVDDALRFDVDLGAVRRAGLSLSSQVLKLARRVRE